MRWMSPAYALTMATPASCVIPFGTDSKGFPMGLQISAPNGSDRLVLAAAFVPPCLLKYCCPLRLAC